MSQSAVMLSLELTDSEAVALAQFVKRVTWTEMRACAADDYECNQIRRGLDLLRQELGLQGYSPR